MSGPAQDPLVSAEWLLAAIEAPDVRVIEATWYPGWSSHAGQAQALYKKGHIPGAVFFDIDEIKDSGSDLPHMLPGTIPFASHMRKMGLGDGNRLIVYDRNNLCAAARVWWMFRVMGHDDVKVLDGGYEAWLAAGGAAEDMPPVPAERHFTPRLRADLVKTVDQVVEASETGTATILDARPAGRFTGEAPEPRENLVSGHIPGSRNIPASEVLDQHGRMKDAARLEEVFEMLEGPVIASCGSGVAAAILALALARIGHWDVAMYDGSWTEWASDPARPVARGAG